MPETILLPLVLSAKKKSWRMDAPHGNESDKRYASIRDQILKRDRFVCRYCGFASERFQEINHLDDDHRNNAPANLVTACPFCHLCHHLGMAGLRRMAYMIWCPEIPQADLSEIVRGIFVAEANAGQYRQAASGLYDKLLARQKLLQDKLGIASGNPGAVGEALLAFPESHYNARNHFLSGIRLLPRKSAFGPQIAWWQRDRKSYGRLPDSEWHTMGQGAGTPSYSPVDSRQAS